MKTQLLPLLNYMNQRLLLLMLCLMALPLQAQMESTEHVLQRYVESYRNDPMAMSAYFGIKVGDQWWNVHVQRQEEPYAVGSKKQYTFHNYGPHRVEIKQGKPDTPTWFFRFDDRSVLDKIDQKIWTASTAAAKSTGADVVAFDIEDMEGYVSDQQDTAIGYLTMEHFWKRDAVEVTYFSRDSSLPSHGAALVSLYTMKDKRIGWFSLGTDEAANSDRGLDKSQVPNLFIITKGRGKGQIADQEIDLEPGMSIFVPPYVKHILYNPYPEPLEGILVLYGDNIDYATGQSYMSFLDKEYEFYGNNQKQHN